MPLERDKGAPGDDPTITFNPMKKQILSIASIFICGMANELPAKAISDADHAANQIAVKTCSYMQRGKDASSSIRAATQDVSEINWTGVQQLTGRSDTAAELGLDILMPMRKLCKKQFNRVFQEFN